jgi:CRISPR/Cas system-associated exonuclease Cas4 (RecB family)
MEATGVHNGIVLYVDKNTLKSKVFEIKFDSAKAAEIFDRFKSLHESLKKNELPEAEAKEAKDMNWMCKYCEYKNKCDENEK